jgi:hypothetical protein
LQEEDTGRDRARNGGGDTPTALDIGNYIFVLSFIKDGCGQRVIKSPVLALKSILLPFG